MGLRMFFYGTERAENKSSGINTKGEEIISSPFRRT